jgi:hypothetical protein
MAHSKRAEAAGTQSGNTLKAAVRSWVREQVPGLEHMLTLTLKQHRRIRAVSAGVNPHGYSSWVKLDDALAQRVCEQFIERLNAEIFRTAARRYGKSLFYLPALERSSTDRLHLHILIGAVPRWAAGTELYRAIGRAKKNMDWLDEQINMVEADSYALTYVTKQVERHNTNAILWQCVPVASKLHQPAASTRHAF